MPECVCSCCPAMQPYTQDSQDRLHILHDPDQDKVATEDEWMKLDIILHVWGHISGCVAYNVVNKRCCKYIWGGEGSQPSFMFHSYHQSYIKYMNFAVPGHFKQLCLHHFGGKCISCFACFVAYVNKLSSSFHTSHKHTRCRKACRFSMRSLWQL